MKSIASPNVHANLKHWLLSAGSSKGGSLIGNQPVKDPPATVKFSTPGIYSSPSSSSRILYNISCKVCRDHSSGKHYGIFTCDGCAGFFKRSIRRSRQYACKNKNSGSCLVDKVHRNQCRACRLTKCLDAGKNKDAVQDERGPRDSTLGRQINLFMKEPHASQTETNNLTAICQKILSIGLITQPAVAEEAACEAAAKLLFMNVRWAKKLGTFSELPLPDRILLLAESWRDLFILGAVPLLPIVATHNHSIKASEFCDVVDSVARAQLDLDEMACLKAIALFQPTAVCVRGLSDPQTVAALQHHAYITLNKHVMTAYPEKPLRFGSLVLLLSSVKMISTSDIENLFFRKTIGNIPMERIISNMYTQDEL